MIHLVGTGVSWLVVSREGVSMTGAIINDFLRQRKQSHADMMLCRNDLSGRCVADIIAVTHCESVEMENCNAANHT